MEHILLVCETIQKHLFYWPSPLHQSCSHLNFCLGDVSGKGMPAALLMANLQATLRGTTMGCKGALDCMKRSNGLLYHSTDQEKYATMFYGILDTEKNQL